MINKNYYYKSVASEISKISKFYDHMVQLAPLENDSLSIFNSINCPKKEIVNDIEKLPSLIEKSDTSSIILLNGNFHHIFDIQELLVTMKLKLSRSSRIVSVLYDPYFKPLFRLANFLGLRRGSIPKTFITRVDLEAISKISGYELVRIRPAVYSPFYLFGIGKFINYILPAIPFFKHFPFVSIAVLRPIIKEKSLPSLSIIIPARNEVGNIENALRRIPDFGGAKLEVIFVEGHSNDNTWEEIIKVKTLYSSKFVIKSFQQAGKGKFDAVKLGSAKATSDLIVILDADLTMPPELLTKFYEAYVEGYGNFVNGSRLVYPMECQAMRTLNLLGNKFFAKALSYVLDRTLSDSLCGTKLFSRKNYEMIVKWREDFGEFDPFGDFEFLFASVVLALGTVDLPIQYKARTYGTTQISRFRDGFLLLKMLFIGFFRIKLGSSK